MRMAAAVKQMIFRVSRKRCPASAAWARFFWILPVSNCWRIWRFDEFGVLTAEFSVLVNLANLVKIAKTLNSHKNRRRLKFVAT